MHPVIWNLRNKLTWMSNRLRWINGDNEIINWMRAMKMVNDMLVDALNNGDLGQLWIKPGNVKVRTERWVISKATEHTSLPKCSRLSVIKKDVMPKTTGRAFNEENQEKAELLGGQGNKKTRVVVFDGTGGRMGRSRRVSFKFLHTLCLYILCICLLVYEIKIVTNILMGFKVSCQVGGRGQKFQNYSR